MEFRLMGGNVEKKRICESSKLVDGSPRAADYKPPHGQMSNPPGILYGATSRTG
jgi:hypothetical protein